MINHLKRWTTVAMLVGAHAALADRQIDPVLRLQAEERYDDDVLLRTQPNGPGQFITKLSPQVGVSAKDHEWKLFTWYTPDVLIHQNSLSGQNNVTLDHRAALQFKRAFSPETNVAVDFKVWRATDPTSLPRLGVGHTLSPILYGQADLLGSTLVTRRVGLRLGHHFEGAKIYDTCDQNNPSGNCSGTATNLNCNGTTCSTAAGFVNAPFAEAFYKASRRTEIGLGDRFQLFSFGKDFGTANGVYGTYRYRLSRETSFVLLGGPTFYKDRNRVVTLGGVVQPNGSGVIPRLNVLLDREGPQLQYGINVGHDLVGASGFTNVLWADYASVYGSYRIFKNPFKVFAAATGYRNGLAPNQGIYPIFSAATDAQGRVITSAGYGVGGGVEWKLNRELVAQVTFDRFGQFGAVLPGQENLTRNVVALRLNVTAF